VGIGAPLTGPAASIEALDPEGDGVYRRDFDNGVVLVNATNPYEDTAVTRTITLERPHLLAAFAGGGTVGPDGASNAAVTFTTVTSVTLPPASGAVLLTSRPAGPPRRHLRRAP